MNNSEMLELLRQRRDAAREYAAQTEAQKKAIYGDDETALKKSLDERAKLIAQIDALNAELSEPLAAYGRGAPDAGIEVLITETRQEFESAAELDRSNISAIKAMMRQATDDTKKLNKSRVGIGKYAQKDIQYSPTLFDKKQ